MILKVIMVLLLLAASVFIIYHGIRLVVSMNSHMGEKLRELKGD